MTTLAELARPVASATGTYRDYVLACAEKGVKPLSQPEWVAAGKPSGL